MCAFTFFLITVPITKQQKVSLKIWGIPKGKLDSATHGCILKEEAAALHENFLGRIQYTLSGRRHFEEVESKDTNGLSSEQNLAKTQ